MISLVPQHLVEGIYAFGGADEIRESVQRFIAAGVTTPILSLMSTGSDLRTAVRELAPRA